MVLENNIICKDKKLIAKELHISVASSHLGLLSRVASRVDPLTGGLASLIPNLPVAVLRYQIAGGQSCC